MTREQLKDGMVIRNTITGVAYVVTDAKNGVLLSISSGSYFTIPSDFSIWKIESEGVQERVFVVTTIIQEGMEFEGDDYCGVFRTREKAEKYFESEKREWAEKLAKRYCADGDKVSIYMVNENTCEIIGNEDYQDCITISIKEKGVQ